MTKVKGINITILLIVVISIGISFSLSYIDLSSKGNLIISQAVIIVPALIYVLVTKQNLFKLIRFNKISFSAVALTIVFTLCIMPLLSLINAVSMLFADNFIKSTAEAIVGDNIIIGLIMLALVPTIVEEVTYRGIIYNIYKDNNKIKAMILSALVFGAMHMNFNQFIYAAILGFIMAIMLEATNSIISTMIMHFVFNGSSAVLIYLTPKLDQLSRSFGEKGISEIVASTEVTRAAMIGSIKILLPVAVFMTIAAIYVFILLADLNGRLKYIKSIFKRNKNEKDTMNLSNKRIVDIFLILAIAICFGFSLLIELGI